MVLQRRRPKKQKKSVPKKSKKKEEPPAFRITLDPARFLEGYSPTDSSRRRMRALTTHVDRLTPRFGACQARYAVARRLVAYWISEFRHAPSVARTISADRLSLLRAGT